MIPWSLDTFWERIAPTFMENWPQAVRDRSLPVLDLQVPWDELLAAMSHTNYRKWFPNLRPNLPLHDLEQRIEDGLDELDSDGFLRLGSRSPKDSQQAKQFGLRIQHGSQGVRLLTTDSRRAAFDIRCAMDYSYMPRLFLRPWREIPDWSEFRCFIQGGEIVGISQYDYQFLGRSAEITNHATAMERVLRECLTDLLPHLPLPDVVADVILIADAAEADDATITPAALESGEYGAKLLELNPFIVQTDPALFSWMQPFDGGFRYLT